MRGPSQGLWYTYDEIPNNGYNTWGKRDCRPYQGSYSGWGIGGGANGVGLPCGSRYPDSSASVMVYGPFSLADAVKAQLSLKYWLQIEPWYDMLCGYGSKNGANFYGACIAGSTGGSWVDWGLDLSNVPGLGNLTGEPQVWIALRFASDDSNTEVEGAYVDNIVVRKCVGEPCPLLAPSASGQPAELQIKR